MNPYSAPTAIVEDAQVPPGRRTAVLIGAAIGCGISYAVLLIFGLVFLWILVAQGVPSQELYARAYQSTGYLVFAHLTSVFCLAPGGYWSTRLDPTNSLVSAVIAGALVSVFSMTSNLLPYELPIPMWSRILSVVIPIPAFSIGALWWRREA